MGAAAHPVTSDKSRSSGLDRWLALPILGDLDPYPPATAPSAPLPTGCPKSPLSDAFELKDDRSASRRALWIAQDISRWASIYWKSLPIESTSRSTSVSGDDAIPVVI